MILLQEDDDAVLELDALWLVGIEVVELGDGDLFPRLGSVRSMESAGVSES